MSARRWRQWVHPKHYYTSTKPLYRVQKGSIPGFSWEHVKEWDELEDRGIHIR